MTEAVTFLSCRTDAGEAGGRVRVGESRQSGVRERLSEGLPGLRRRSGSKQDSAAS